MHIHTHMRIYTSEERERERERVGSDMRMYRCLHRHHSRYSTMSRSAEMSFVKQALQLSGPRLKPSLGNFRSTRQRGSTSGYPNPETPS